MTSRALRIALLLVFVGLLAGTGYIVWQEERARTRSTAAAREVAEALDGAVRALLEVKSAQPGYVAAGQGEDFWVGRVDALLTTTRAALDGLEGRATDPDGRASLQGAREALRDFEQMDRRARSYARSGQRLLASDLIFSDGIEKIDATLAALDRAQERERAAAEAREREGRTAQLLAAAAGTAGGLLTMLALVPLPPAARRPDAAAGDAPRTEEPAPVISRPETAPPPQAPAEKAAPTPASGTMPAPLPIDLSSIATLCTDLARVLDRQALPAALERAARILNASGLIVWVADPDGRELVPVIAHGYPQALLVRLGRIPSHAENVTAAAYRTGLMQTLHADSSSNGAIAAPLIGADGPVGVMAAEVLENGERQETIRAAAAIIAAQLATLMGPPPVRAEAAGAG